MAATDPMAAMASGSAPALPSLVLVVTRECNLRCGFCPVALGPERMSRATARRALDFYLEKSAAPVVKFFGGEPLLRFGLIRECVEAVRARFRLPTNGLLLDDSAVSFLERHPEVEVSVSRVQDPGRLRRLPNLCVNVPIPPEAVARLPRYFAGLLRQGFRRFNFLPSYYRAWPQEALSRLADSLKAVARLIALGWDRELPIRVRNLEIYGPVPLFNPGWVVDCSGDVYTSNMALTGVFSGLRERLRLGHVRRPGSLRWDRARTPRRSWWASCLSPDAVASTEAVDRELTGFVTALRAAGGTA